MLLSPMTETETKLLHLLVAALDGFSVDLIPMENGKVIGPGKPGFSVGRGRSIRLEDIAAIFAKPEPEPMRPDMLAALKTAYAAISLPEIYTVHPVAAARITILDAIEKAEGIS